MRTTYYTPEELEEAKEFLRRRLDSEKSMREDVERLLDLFAILLLELFLSGRGDQIEEVIAPIVSMLVEDCHTLGVDDRYSDMDAILAHMDMEVGGDTLAGRVDKRCRTFVNEIGAVATAGLLLNKDKSTILESIRANYKHPYDNEILTEVRKEIDEGRLSSDYDFSTPHYGRGVEISSMGALETITTFAVADAWMDWQYVEAKERGAVGYYVLRGSSYPCVECDSHTGIFFTIDNEDNKPQYHLNCCCIVVYSYVDRL